MPHGRTVLQAISGRNSFVTNGSGPPIDVTMTRRYVHLSPAALDAAIKLLDEPRSEGGVGVSARQMVTRGAAPSCRNVETWWRQDPRINKRSIRPGVKLAVRQGFEPWIQLLGRITV